MKHPLRIMLWLLCVLAFNIELQSQALISATVVAEHSIASLTSQTGFAALNGVTAYKVLYTTQGSDSKLDTASGLVVLPDDPTISSLIAYQHGTSDYDDVPSAMNGEATLALVIAGQGYIATAADYLGMGESRGFHPYVHAGTEASAGVDLLLATKELLAREEFESIEHIFVTGYSQGGHAAMAMAQAIQERETDDLWITAAAPMSGPYSLSGTMLDLITSDTMKYFFPSYAVYTMLGYQEVYNGIYDSIPEVFKPAFVDMVRQFYQKEISLNALNSFIVQELTINHRGSVPSRMFNDSFIDEIRSDTNHIVRRLLADNDTYRWVPQFPMRMYYCTADDQVSYINSIVAEEYMVGNGAEDVEAIDISPTADHGECILPAALATLQFFNGFKTVSARTSIASELLVYPNPTATELMVEIPHGISYSVHIFNLQGQLIKTVKQQQRELISVRDLHDGHYLMMVQSEKGSVYYSRFSVQH